MSGWMFEGDFIETWAYAEEVFSKEECRKIIDENPDLVNAVVNINRENDPTIRESKVCWLKAEEKNKWIFERLANIILSLNHRYFKFNISGIIEDIQLTKYEAPSGFYGKHIDKMYGYLNRKLSVTVQLSDPKEYEGGELKLYVSEDPLVMSKEIGRLVIFPSYVLHEVTPVTKGTRYSLVVWVSGDPFK